MVDDDDTAIRTEVCRRQAAPERRRHAEEVEEPLGDLGADRAHRAPLGDDARLEAAEPGDVLQRRDAILPVEQVRGRHRHHPALGMLLHHGDELAIVAVRQRPQGHRIDHRPHAAREADAQGEQAGEDQRHAGAAHEDSQREADIEHDHLISNT